MTGRTGRAESSTKPIRRMDTIPGPWSTDVTADWSTRLGSPGEFIPAPHGWPNAAIRNSQPRRSA